jgi:hypothetical protein
LKTAVFGLLKRDGRSFMSRKNCTKEQLMPTIQGKILEWSIINTDGLPKSLRYLMMA